MALPAIMMIIILGRSVSLDNAGEGVRQYFATWHSYKLADGQIWQTAWLVRTPPPGYHG